MSFDLNRFKAAVEFGRTSPNPAISDCSGMMAQAAKEIQRLESVCDGFRFALTPSPETKGTYIGEFTTWGCDDCGDVPVSWTAIKEIMRGIRDEAAGVGQ